MTAGVRKRKHKLKSNAIAGGISQLCRSFEPAIIRSALVREWIAANDVSKQRLRRCSAVMEIVERESADVPLPDALRNPNLKELEFSFESLMDTEHRRSHGVVYTPEWVIDYLVSDALQNLGMNLSSPVICDPACGSGGFLLCAAEILHHQLGISFEHAFADCLIGFDRDALAIDHARCLAELFLLSKGVSPPRDGFRFQVKDSLLDDADPAGYDVVTTNPPYVKLQNLPVDYRKRLEEKYGDLIKGSYSLALLFLVAGYRMLSSNGQLAYITQNNFFTSLAGEPLRRYLHEHRCVRRIIDFGHEHLFANASAYTCLLFLSSASHDQIEFARLSGTSPAKANVLSMQGDSIARIPLDQLDPKKWRLASGSHFGNLQRIETAGVPLGEVAEIRVGFATLRDAVSLVEDTGDTCVAKGPDGHKSIIEREATRPAVKVADLGDERDLQRNRTRILFPYEKVNGKFYLIPVDRFRERFPSAFSHLSRHRDVLGTRDKGKPNAEGWYAWGRSQGRESPGPKLLTKTFDRRPNFMLDSSDQLFCNGYSISLPQQGTLGFDMPLELLQFILNSDVMHYYATLTSFQIEGGYQCYQKNFIEKFGIPRLSDKQRECLMAMDRVGANGLLAEVYGIARQDLLDVLGSTEQRISAKH